MMEGYIDKIIIVGNKLQVKLPEQVLATAGVAYDKMKIINESSGLIDAMHQGLGQVREDIVKGRKVASIKVLAPESKGEEIMQNYRFVKRLPENEKLEGVPVQLLRVREDIPDSKRLINTVSLHLNPGRHGLAWLGRTMASLLSKQ